MIGRKMDDMRDDYLRIVWHWLQDLRNAVNSDSVESSGTEEI